MSRTRHPAMRVAVAEWRAWARSRLAPGAALLFLLLLAATTVLTALRMQAERAERQHHQREAEAAFLSQPDRHPHRMVHYGHYVFRTPAPLALFDPGLDAVTGQSMFLEGHRQNSAMFAAGGASADLGGFGTPSPASVWQLFAPLLLILLGHGAVGREREAGTLATLLAQGLSPRTLLAGKALALAGAVAVMLLPLAAAAGLAVAEGEAPSAALALLVAYALYGLLWAGLALLASALLRRRAAALAALATAWIGLTLVLPALAASSAAASAPMPGQLETDLAMLADLRRLGDGHNANDPAFAQLRADLLKQHGAERVEDLPVNLRGVVAEYSERKLTATLDAWAARRMAGEARQAEALARHGWATPTLALAEASRAVAATDLAHHHRFLRAAEALRFDFVQGLNRVHARQLAYADDIRRSSDPQAERRTRVAASNWQLLDRFRFEPDPAATRWARAAQPMAMLLAWAAALAAALLWAGARLRP
jgi:ABC-2 type transport system permease protein